MRALREQRVRALMGQRYDNRAGVVDWDYNEGVRKQASIVHPRQYREWRESGVAFEFGDQTYTVANRSMATYAEVREGGLSKLRRGFWADIQVSPFFCFGVDCDQPNQHARDLFKVANKGQGTEQHTHTAVHVSVHSVASMLHEIETGRVYEMTKAGDVYSGLEQRAGSEGTPEQGQAADDDKHAFALHCARQIVELKDRASIALLTGDDFSGSLGKAKYKGLFDVCWISNHNAHLLTKASGLDQLLGASPLVLVETARNMVMLTPEAKQQYVDKVVKLGESAGLRKLRWGDAAALEYLAFSRADAAAAAGPPPAAPEPQALEPQAPPQQQPPTP